MQFRRRLLLLAVVTMSNALAASADRGLVMSFEASGSDVALVSASSNPAEPGQNSRARTPQADQWSITVDASGETRWTRSFVAPRQFHAGRSTPISFSLHVPRLKDATVTLRDASHQVLWTGPIDASLLAAADARALRWRALGTAAAERKRGNTASSTLARQINAEAGRTIQRDARVGLAPRERSAHSGAVTAPKSAYEISGRVTDRGAPHWGAEVRAYDAQDRFVASAHTDQDGRYTLGLPSGTYRVEADEYRYHEIFRKVAWLFRAPATVSITAGSDSTIADIPLPTAASEILLRLTVPCAVPSPSTGNPYMLVVNAATPDGRHVQHAMSPTTAPVSSGEEGICLAPYALQVSPGTYSLAITPLGWPTRQLGAVDATGDVQVAASFTAQDRTRMWSGSVRDASGKPMSLARITVFDEAYRAITQVFSSPAGAFSLPWQPGWRAEIQVSSNASANSLRHSLAFGDTAPSGDITLDAAALSEADGANDIHLVYGTGETDRRYNIVFVAEGYTELNETYTDSNGNGVWDGVLWHDLNGNGTYDSDDFVQTYGNAALPTIGSVPGSQNEPFVDLNGDGALSIDDRALFERNVHSYLRSMLGSDGWNARRDLFNAYIVFDPSEQAGYDIRHDEQGADFISRNTMYGAFIELDRNLLLLDRAAAWERAALALSDVDLVVALVNQPVQAGRANATFGEGAVIVYYGGIAETSANGTTQAHEMGHSIAGLCDEYVEYPEQHPLDLIVLPDCANNSYSPEREQLPWRDQLPQDQRLPSVDTDGSPGAYIGSDYYADGAYRPSLNSMMSNQFANPFFNEPSLDAIHKAACSLNPSADNCGHMAGPEMKSATWWNPSESGWGVFSVDQGSTLSLGWFTYDDDGEPTWFLLPNAAPQQDGSYVGDLLRHRGTRLDQINGNAETAASTLGEATLRFSSDGQTLEFDTRIDGVLATRSLERFIFGDADIVCRESSASRATATNYSDLWWSPESSGWGVHMSHVGETIYATWYTYDASKESTFFVAAMSRKGDGSFSGMLRRQHDGIPYSQIDGTPPSAGSDVVGSVTLEFSDGETAEFGYVMGQTARSKTLKRLLAGNTASVCEVVESRN